MGEPARSDPGAVGRFALDGAAWDSAPLSPRRPAGWGPTPGRAPHGDAVLGPRRQGVEEAAAGAGLHHQRLEAGDQAGLGEQRGLELWVQDSRPSPGPACLPPAHLPPTGLSVPPAPVPCLSTPHSPTSSLGPSPTFMPPTPSLTHLVQEVLYSSCMSRPPCCLCGAHRGSRAGAPRPGGRGCASALPPCPGAPLGCRRWSPSLAGC